MTALRDRLIAAGEDTTGIPFFAWCDIGDEFDPAVHAIHDDDPIRIEVEQDENQHAVARVTFPPVLGAIASDKEAAWISVDIGGQIVPLFYGLVSRAPIGFRAEEVVVEFIAKALDDEQRVANLLSWAAANTRALYVPEFGEANSPTDEETILAASTVQIEYDRVTGHPSLCPIFGSPDDFVVLTPDDVLEEIEIADNGTPARGALVSILLDWEDHRVTDTDAGTVVQAEIERVGTFFGMQANQSNFTFTPDVLTSWPKQGETIGNAWQVRYSALVPMAGPGTDPKTPSDYEPILIPQPSKEAAGVMIDAADFDAEGFDGSGESMVALEATSFSQPLLNLYGVQKRQRRELVQIYIPFDGQEVVKGNGRVIPVDLSASGLDKDETTPGWEIDTEYQVGDEVQEHGVLWQCQVQHRSRTSLLGDSLDVSDPASSTYGLTLWEPRENSWNGPLGRSEVMSAALTSWGRRAIENGVRRGATALGYSARMVEVRLTVPIALAYPISTRTTLRIDDIDPTILKGGFVEGKVTAISFFFDGDSGDMLADIVMMSTVGSGDNDDDLGNVEPIPADSIENVDYATSDPDGIYEGPFPTERPAWWPVERSWPPNADEDTMGYYTHSYGVRVEAGNSYLYQVNELVGLLPPLSSNPYEGVTFPSEMPAWWPVVNGDQFNSNNGKQAFPWPPGSPIDNSVYPPIPDVMASSDPFQFYKVAPENDYLDGSGGVRGEVFEGGIPDGDPDTDRDDFEPGEEVPVAGPGGSWDRVRYSQPFVTPELMTDDIATCRINWLGVEQAYALANPGQPIPDPYGTLEGAEKQFRFYGPIDRASEWLQRFSTEIIVGIREPHDDDIEAQRVNVICFRGWRGPRQFEV